MLRKRSEPPENLSLDNLLPIGPGLLPQHLMYNLAIVSSHPAPSVIYRVFIDSFTQEAAWEKGGEGLQSHCQGG